MNILQQPLFQAHEESDSVDAAVRDASSKQQWSAGFKDDITATTSRKLLAARQRLYNLPSSVKLIGASVTMDEYEKRKLGIFNQLNFFQLVTGICIPIVVFFNNKNFSQHAWLMTSLPAIISMVVLVLNAYRKHETAIIFYFIFYPVVTSIVYMSGINMGMELFFILYGILSVFFLHKISDMLFSVSLSMISYFMLAVVWKSYRFQLESTNLALYLFNQFAGIVFIFYGLFLVKKENTLYHVSILAKNKEIEEGAALLQQQTDELTELNGVKNKLFSVIAHDLKTPMYALRNLFSNIQQQDIPAAEIKGMMPDVINNLNYTTGLMENLLQWAKCQMHAEAVKIQTLDMAKMINETISLLKLQATAKQLRIENSISGPVMVKADKDMINLVLRNLLSNAIKFTPAKGKIVIGANTMSSFAEVFVKDNGRGIGPEALQKINRNDYFTTNGTAQEPGTGLGLMLCKDFLQKNDGALSIQSEPGKGSTFSFSLPIAV